MPEHNKLTQWLLEYPHTAFLIAVGTCVFIAAFTLALAVAGQPRIVPTEALSAVAAWSSLATALTTGLLALGAGLAALGVREQIAEARRSRQDALRPVLIVTEAHPEDPHGGNEPARLVIKNIGPGPALRTTIEVWITEGMPAAIDNNDDMQQYIDQEGSGLVASGGADLSYPWALNIPAMSEVKVPIWKWGAPRVPVSGSDRLRYRIRFADVFGNEFAEPENPSHLGHIWVKDYVLDGYEGDHSVHYR